MSSWADDADDEATAMRETQEEVGLDLSAAGGAFEVLGELRAAKMPGLGGPGEGPLVVTPFVFAARAGTRWASFTRFSCSVSSSHAARSDPSGTETMGSPPFSR